MRTMRGRATGFAVAVLVVVAASGLTACHWIDTKVLPKTYVGLGVVMPLQATGGEGPLTWSATGLPPGLAIDPGTGAISGTPTTAGTYSVTVSAVDPASNGATATVTYALEVSEPAAADVIVALGAPGPAFASVISDDGRYVAYSTADPQYREDPDQQGIAHLVLDRTTRETTVAFFDDSLSSDRLSLSGDGRFLAFVDHAPSSSGPDRVGVWDRSTGDIDFLPGPTGDPTVVGAFSPVISDDGRFVAYAVDSYPGGYLYLYDRVAGTTTPIAPMAVQVEYAELSGDGSTVAFATPTAGVVPGDTNGRGDVFLWDRTTGATTRITDNQLGSPGQVAPTPRLSTDGNHMTFTADLAGPGQPSTFVWDRATGTTTSLPTWGIQPRISSDGQRVLYDTDQSSVPAGGSSLVVWDRPTGSVRRTGGIESPGRDFSFAGDGRHLVGGGGFFDELSAWDLLD